MDSMNNGVDVGDEEVLEIDGAGNMWTDELESYFITVMVNEIMKGSMQSTTFANAAWKSIAAALRIKTGRRYTYCQLKNKYHNLRARWSDFGNLLKEKEISYDSVTGKVSASDDVWTKLYSRYRRAKSFRKKGLKDYDKFCIIFGCPETTPIRQDESNKKQICGDSIEVGRDAHAIKDSEKLVLQPHPISLLDARPCERQNLAKKMMSTAPEDRKLIGQLDPTYVAYQAITQVCDDLDLDQGPDDYSDGVGDASGANTREDISPNSQDSPISPNVVDVGDDEVVEIDGAGNMWTDELESYFITVMVNEIMKGSMQSTTFAKAAWKSIAAALRIKTGRQYTYCQLKNKYHNLRARWSDFGNLLKEKEISYNSVTGKVNASDDVWRKLYSRYRRAKSFRKKGLKDYDKLCIIFGCPETTPIRQDESNKKQICGDSIEAGRDARAIKDSEKLVLQPHPISLLDARPRKRQNLAKRMISTASGDAKYISYPSTAQGDLDTCQLDPTYLAYQAIGQVCDDLDLDQGPDDSSDGVGDASGANTREDISPKSHDSPIVQEESRKKKKLNTAASYDSVGNADDSQQRSGQGRDDVVRCMEALNSLEGIDGPSYVKALKYIHDDPLWRKMFLCMPDKRKKDWVLNI